MINTICAIQLDEVQTIFTPVLKDLQHVRSTIFIVKSKDKNIRTSKVYTHAYNQVVYANELMLEVHKKFEAEQMIEFD